MAKPLWWRILHWLCWPIALAIYCWPQCRASWFDGVGWIYCWHNRFHVGPHRDYSGRPFQNERWRDG